MLTSKNTTAAIIFSQTMFRVVLVLVASLVTHSWQIKGRSPLFCCCCVYLNDFVLWLCFQNTNDKKKTCNVSPIHTTVCSSVRARQRTLSRTACHDAHDWLEGHGVTDWFPHCSFEDVSEALSAATTGQRATDALRCSRSTSVAGLRACGDAHSHVRSHGSRLYRSTC